MSRQTFVLSLLLRQIAWGISLLCVVFATVEAQWLWLLAGTVGWGLCQALALLIACVKMDTGAVAEPAQVARR